MKLPDRIKILELYAISVQQTRTSEDAHDAARAWIEDMTRRADEAGTLHEEHDSPIAYICRYVGIAVRDFRCMLRERVGYAK